MRIAPSMTPGMIFIAADNGKALINPNVDGIFCTVDAESADGWSEVDYDPTQDVDDSEALDIILGGAE